ncbi:WPP domain-interacting tail-anchored protein 2-like [Momordica charantia]|uniref:WPP domain-interacting tail-anchored protein 2-like n=1 Tax=Momordica charantia TaxID=3673 RepID=A0A6J1CZC2_MOMCH|nr:WPP domain-interacting tail-anchored protein 2-like [Momordica charantia]XP_022146431.1 WPP domain-interacting tail-anchored protein 2-like [Momordica charantia]XP_022146432.1 WPP domain-interacting tail-anchored protein 2-like [Momordica charantia]
MDENPGIYVANEESERLEMQELENTMKTLTKLELDLAYCSEKLMNLHVLLMCLLAQENDFEAMDLENDYIPDDSFGKVLAFDFLSGFLDSEVRELDSFMNMLEEEIIGARRMVSSCRQSSEVFNVVEEKLHDSEKSLVQSRKQILEVMMQSTKLQRIVLSSGNWRLEDPVLSSNNDQVLNIYGKSNTMTEQQRHILRMLEKSLARELDLEKKLSESKQREEELRLKLHYTEQVALRMEEAAEVVWGRFLEADNSVEVLMGISKELVGRLQLVQFNLHGSFQRENEMKSKFQDWTEQLKAKEVAIQELEKRNAEKIAKSAELDKLREEVKSLEEQLKESRLDLKNAFESEEASQDQLIEMENLVESLKEGICMAENRAEGAEAKLAQLQETNLELTEEVNFLKDSASSKEKKVGSLEKQLREQEIQLQHAKSSSEASQEQQNMLYSAIWDMETLIEDLKSKVSKAESKTDTAEEHCIILSEANFELNKELTSLKARVEFLEKALDQANSEKCSNANEINSSTKFIMDMVLQLAVERDRIQRQLSILTNDNKALIERLKNVKDGASVIICDGGDYDKKEQSAPKNDVNKLAQ